MTGTTSLPDSCGRPPSNSAPTPNDALQRPHQDDEAQDTRGQDGDRSLGNRWRSPRSGSLSTARTVASTLDEMAHQPVDLSIETAAEVAAMSRVACPYDRLAASTVRLMVFDDADPQRVWGVYDAGLEAVMAAVVRRDRGFVKLLAVHPRMRRLGVGRMLLEGAERFCAERGATSVEIGTSAPRYVSPGVDVRLGEAACLLHANGYERWGETVNLGVALRGLPEPDKPAEPARPDDLAAISSWTESEAWIEEARIAMARESLYVIGDRGFAAVDPVRAWFGPVAVHPSERGRGLGRSLLLSGLHALARAGHDHAQIVWALEAHDFYVRAVGARVSRVFWWYRKSL